MARTISVLVTVLVLAFCGSALAADRYVDGTTGSNGPVENPCDDPAFPCKTIPWAVSHAEPGDTIRVAAGTYTQPLASVPQEVHFVGAGSGSSAASNTIVTPATGAAMRLLAGGSVTGMRLVGGDGSDGIGLALGSNSAGTPRAYSVSNVVAVGGTDLAAPASAVTVSDQGAAGADIAATFDQVTATADFWPQPIVLVTGADVSATFTNSTIDIPIVAHGMRVRSGASAVLSRTDVIGHEFAPTSQSGTAISVQNAGSEITIDRSRVVAPTGPVSINNGGSGVIRDSVIAQVRELNFLSDNAAIFVSENSGQAAHADIIGSTVISHGPNSDAALRVQVVAAGGTPSATVRNSVFRNTDTTSDGTSSDVLADASFAAGSATINADHSAFTTLITTGIGTATATAPTAAGNVAGDPLFKNALTDLSLQAGSPLIDGGDPSVVTAGETDLAGNPRSLDSNKDCIPAPEIGAYEITGNELATCPQTATEPGTGSGPGTGTPTGDQPPAIPAVVDVVAPLLGRASFAPARFAVAKATTPLSAATRRVRRGSSLRFTLSERADVTIVIQRRVGRRWRKAATLLRKGMAPGTVRVRFTGRIRKRPLRPGRYRALVTAKDQAGNRSKPRTASFAIIRG